MKTLLTLIVLTICSPVTADELNLNIGLEHISNILIKENGHGYNGAFIDLEYKNKGMFASVGLGYHSESTDCPEICYGGNGPLGRVRIGISIDLFK